MAIDPDLIRALHLVAEGRSGAAADPAAPHRLFQTSTVSALMDARYDGDITVAELLRHGDLGLGTLAGLDGEMIVVDGVARVARADGRVSAVDTATATPFAVVTPFTPGPPRELRDLPHDALLERLDVLSPAPVSAVRIDGRFRRLRLRSVPRQHPPYPPLDVVVRSQVEWEITDVEAVLVGFRFPQAAAGLEVPGWHLHALTRDNATGGHVLTADLDKGAALLDGAEEVHVELPPGVDLATVDATARAEIERVETLPRDEPSPGGLSALR